MMGRRKVLSEEEEIDDSSELFDEDEEREFDEDESDSDDFDDESGGKMRFDILIEDISLCMYCIDLLTLLVRYKRSR